MVRFTAESRGRTEKGAAGKREEERAGERLPLGGVQQPVCRWDKPEAF